MLSRSQLKALADEAYGKEDALKEVTKTVAKAWKAVKDGYAQNTIPDQVTVQQEGGCIRIAYSSFIRLRSDDETVAKA